MVGSYAQLDSLGDDADSLEDPGAFREESILIVRGLGIIPPLELYLDGGYTLSCSCDSLETSTAPVACTFRFIAEI
jgi:hypothetical protein